MEEYDRVAVYRESETAASSTAPNIGSVSTPPVFTIDSDDDSTESIPAANQANNPPSTSGTQNQSSSIEIVISDDDDGTNLESLSFVFENVYIDDIH